MNEEIVHTSENLITYLRDQLNDPMIGYESPLTQLHGGVATRSYRFRLKGAQEEFTEPLVLRLYPEYSTAEDAVWEGTVQDVLAAKGYPAAKVRITCTDESILGGAFFIMDFLPGTLLAIARVESVPGLLGRTHAALHRIDPRPIIKSLGEQGVDESRCFLGNRLDELKDRVSEFPWLRSAVDWLIENHPPEPGQLAVCHGDFHPINILVHDGVVTGVLDWPCFRVADPVLDVATTVVLITIPYKHLMKVSGPDLSPVDWKLFERLYLDAYQAEVPLDESHLDYYRVTRCVNALVEGAEGLALWRHPLIFEDLLEYIHSVAGIQITMPAP